MRGLLAVEDAEDGLRTHGTIVGLEPSRTGGWHIHSGYSALRLARSAATTTMGSGRPVDPFEHVLRGGREGRGADRQDDAVVLDAHARQAAGVRPDGGRALGVELGCEAGVRRIGGAFGVTAAVAFTEQFPGMTARTRRWAWRT